MFVTSLLTKRVVQYLAGVVTIPILKPVLRGSLKGSVKVGMKMKDLAGEARTEVRNVAAEARSDGAAKAPVPTTATVAK